MDLTTSILGGQKYTETNGRSAKAGPIPLTRNNQPQSGAKVVKDANPPPAAPTKISKEKSAPSGTSKTNSIPPKPPGVSKTSAHYNPATATSVSVNDVAISEELNKLQTENEELKNSKSELKAELDRLEKERDFYFDKLRDIEMMLQDLEDHGEGTELTANIFKILYATAEGFEPADVEDDLLEVEGAVPVEDTY
jgi:microtubule-associated protein, RP/EB family